MTPADLRTEARRRGAEQRAMQGLPALIVDPVILRHAAEALTSAVSNAAPVSAVRAAALESGAAGRVHSPSEVLGEVASIVGPSSTAASPARSTPNKQETAVAGTTTVSQTASSPA